MAVGWLSRHQGDKGGALWHPYHGGVIDLVMIDLVNQMSQDQLISGSFTGHTHSAHL